MEEKKNNVLTQMQEETSEEHGEEVNKEIVGGKAEEQDTAGFFLISEELSENNPPDTRKSGPQLLIEERPFWKIWQFFVIIVILFFLQLGLRYIFPAGQDIEYVVVGIICQLFLFAGVPIFLCHHYDQPLQKLGIKNVESDFAVITGIKWGIGLYFLGIIASILINLIYPMKQEIPDLVKMLLETGTLPFKIFIAISLMVFAPIGEELLFRGFLFGALRKRFSVKWAVIISGAIFGGMHFSIQGFPALFIGGMGFALLYNKYGNILINMIAHCAWNSVVVLLAFLVL